MNRQELLKSKEYWVSQFQIMLFEAVDDYIENKGLNKTKFAEQLNVSKGYISQVLNGDFDHKISKYVELSLACEKVPLIKMVDLDEYLGNEICGFNVQYDKAEKELALIDNYEPSTNGNYLDITKNYPLKTYNR